MQRFLDPAVLAGISRLTCWQRRWWMASLPDCTARRTLASARSLRNTALTRQETTCVMWIGICLRALNAVSEALSRRNQQPVNCAAGRKQLDAVHLRSDDKMDYARFIAASLFYLAIITSAMRPASSSLTTRFATTWPIHAAGPVTKAPCGLERAEPHARTDFEKPFDYFQELLHRRGMAIVISDFYSDPGNRAYR